MSDNADWWARVIGVVALAVAGYSAWQGRRTADETKRVADVSERSASQSARQERMQARPRIVSTGGGTTTDRMVFQFRNDGGRMTNACLVGEDPSSLVNLTTDGTGTITLSGKLPTLPHNVRVEYEDMLGNRRTMTIELRKQSGFQVLAYDSDQ
jgi:hypothetical protein